MKKFAQFITEVYHSGFMRPYGKPHQIDVYKNPTHKEMKEISHDGSAAAILHGKDMYAFDRDHLHETVRKHLGLNNHVSLTLYHHKKEVDANVSDNVKHTKWHHNPKIKEHIQNHPEMKKHFNKIDVSYYDEDVHGPWHEMKQRDNSA